MNKIRFEKITLDNCEEAVKIYDDNHNLKTDIAKLKKQIARLADNSDYYNMAVYSDEKIVGILTAIVNHNIVEALHPFMTVWNLGVARDYRRKGIGTQILDYIFNLAKDLNCDFVALLADSSNKAAINLQSKSSIQSRSRVC